MTIDPIKIESIGPEAALLASVAQHRSRGIVSATPEEDCVKNDAQLQTRPVRKDVGFGMNLQS